MKIADSVLMFYSRSLNTLYLLNLRTNDEVKIKDKSARKIYNMLKKKKKYNVDVSELIKMGFIDDKQ